MYLHGMTIGDIPRKNARLYPNKVGVIGNGRRLTFKDFDDEINRLANLLSSMGLKKGDRVGILQNNCLEYFVIYFALAKLGLVAVTMHYAFKSREITYIMNNSEAKCLIVGENYIETVNQCKDKMESISIYISLSDRAGDGYENYKALTKEESPEDPNIEVSEEDLLWLTYTSGTTGNPKGAMITHRSLMTNSLNVLLESKSDENDVFVCGMPFFHLGGASFHMAFFQTGSKNVLLADADPTRFLEAVEKERGTVSLWVPEVLRKIIESGEISNYDVSSLAKIVYGGAILPMELLKKLKENFPTTDLLGLYGQVELSNVATFLPVELHVTEGSDEELRRACSQGRETKLCEVKIFDENDNELPCGEVGEIVVRGSNVMQGYWGMEEATQETFRNGWQHTGDMGYMDEKRYIYLVDRKKDVIRSASENIFSREIEEVILEHSAVKDVAVIGIPDEKWGESVMAIIVKHPGAEATETDIIEFCKSELASYKKPKKVEFITEDLPRNVIGKVLKRELREKYWKGKEKRIN